MRVQGLPVSTEIAAIARFAERIGWQVEATRRNQLKITGPHGEGPAFIGIRARYTQDLQNAIRNLRSVGFPVEAMKEEGQNGRKAQRKTSAATEEDTTEIMELPVPDTIEVLPPTISPTGNEAIDTALDTLARTLTNQFADIEQVRSEAHQWQQLAESESARVQELEAQKASTEQRLIAMTKRAERAEEWKRNFQSLMKD